MSTAAALLLLAAPLVPAASLTWNGADTVVSGNGNWSDANNWVSLAVPTLGDTLTFTGAVGLQNTNDYAAGYYFNQLFFGAGGFVLQGGNALTLTNATQQAIYNNSAAFCSNVINCPLVLSNLLIIQTTVSSPAVGGSSITLNGGVTAGGKPIQVNKDGAGAGGAASVLYFSGGVSSFGNLFLRKGGVVINNGASVQATNATIGFDVTFNGIDPYLQVDGAGSKFLITNASAITLGGAANNAKVVVTDGLVALTNATVLFAQSASANVTWQQSGGTTVMGTLRVNNGTAAINLSGGSFTALSEGSKLAEVGSGVLTVSGGLFQIKSDGSGKLDFSTAATTSGNSTVNLNGGMIKVGRLVRTSAVVSGTHKFYFNGGTLQAGATTNLFFPVLINTTAYVGSGGAVLDTQGFNDTIGTPLLTDPALGGATDGGLTKLGSGTLTLTNVNTYNGPTLVMAGTLTNTQPSLASGSTVAIASGAKLSLSFSGANTLAGLLLNGVPQPAGTYTAANTSAYLSGTGSLVVTGAANPIWMGGGPDTFLNDATNWGGTVPAFDGSALVAFAAGGTTATVNTNAGFAGMAFSVNKNFTLAAGGGTVTNGAAGITAAGLNTNTFTIACGLNLAANQTWDVATNGNGPTVLAVTGVIADNGAGYGITKTNAGTLVLSAANTYAGPTVVSGGTLTVSSAQLTTNTIAVKSGATLNVTVSGASQLSPSALNLDVSQTIGFSDLKNSATAPIKVGSLVNSGPTTINILSGMFAAGYGYPLIQYTTSGGGGSFVLGSLPAGVAATLGTNGNNLVLNVSVAPALVWCGTVSGTWDASALNWNAGTFAYADPLAVKFDDTASGSTSVTIPSTVAPSSMLVSNSIKSYAFSGSPIGGLGSLTKSGKGTLTLASANTYSGDTLLQGGILSVGNNASLGTGGITVGANSALQALNTVTVPNNATWQNGIVLTNDPNGNILTLSGSLSTTNGILIFSDSSNSGLGTGTGVVRLTGTNILVADPSVASTATNIIRVSNGHGSRFNLEFAGGSTLLTNYVISANANGSVVVSGGSHVWVGTAANDNGVHLAGASCNLTMSNGTVLCSALSIGYGGATTNTFSMYGGSFTNLDPISFGENIHPTGLATINLNGGTLNVPSILRGGVNYGMPAANFNVNFNGGVLQASADSTNFLNDSGMGMTLNVLTNGAIVDTGNFSITFSNALLNGDGGGGGLTKVGNGTLLLNAYNTYTGLTTVSAGVLGGTGTISGSVTNAAGAAIASGADQIGTLTVNGNLVSSGGFVIKVDTSLSQSNDVVSVGGTLAQLGSGVMTVSNLGPALVAGDSFGPFNGAILPGGALLTISPAPGAGLGWSNRLAVDGTIVVVAAAPSVPPSFSANALSFSGGVASLTATGAVGTPFTVWTTTNVALTPIASTWMILTNGTVSTSPFVITDPGTITNNQRFYLFSTP